MRILFSSLPLALAMLSLSACTVEERPARYSTYAAEPAAPPPQEAPPANEVVYQNEPPPAPPPQPEVIPVAPGPDFVWVAGYHRWDGHAYVWVGGRYNRRPHPNANWRPAHWENRGRGHVFVEGRWN